MSDTEIKIDDTVAYHGNYAMPTLDMTKLKVEAVIPSADKIVVTGLTESGDVTCIMASSSYFSLSKKTEEEKLKDLLHSVGVDAFCKIMAETIEKHNELHQQVIKELDKMSLRFYSLSAPFQLNNICELKQFIEKQLDK